MLLHRCVRHASRLRPPDTGPVLEAVTTSAIVSAVVHSDVFVTTFLCDFDTHASYAREIKSAHSFYKVLRYPEHRQVKNKSRRIAGDPCWCFQIKSDVASGIVRSLYAYLRHVFFLFLPGGFPVNQIWFLYTYLVIGLVSNHYLLWFAVQPTPNSVFFNLTRPDDYHNSELPWNVMLTNCPRGF
jgi:hypothetical protein